MNKKTAIASKKEQQDIFALFIKNHQLKFSDIEKTMALRSNHLSYHLDKLVYDGVLTKRDDFYVLTQDGEAMIPFFSQITGKEQGPLSIITAAIINGEKICLLQREKRPYKGYWGLIGGKLKLSESIRETALREAKEETNLDCTFEKLVSVLHERVKEEDTVKHAFVIFFCKLAALATKTRSCDEGKLAWFELSNLPPNIIPSDRVMITELLHQDFCAKDVLIVEKDGQLTNMEVEHGGWL